MRLYDKVDLSECYHLLENHVLLDDRDLIDRLIRGDMENDYTYSGHSQIGRDTKRNGETFHIAEKYKIFDMESKKNLYIDDQRIDPGLKELMWICNSHYTNRQDETLVKEITYKKYET